MKTFWQGSDTLYLIQYPPSRRVKYIYMFCLRLFAKVIDFFTQEHICDHKLQKFHLIQFGMKKPIIVRAEVVKYQIAFPKKRHEGFNILYYFPKREANLKFTKWLYGYDIFEELKSKLTDVNWIVVNGDSDMSKIFPIVDYYLRPTRHDGASRLRQECEINNITYYWSQQNPKIAEIEKEIEACRLKLL